MSCRLPLTVNAAMPKSLDYPNEILVCGPSQHWQRKYLGQCFCRDIAIKLTVIFWKLKNVLVNVQRKS